MTDSNLHLPYPDPTAPQKDKLLKEYGLQYAKAMLYHHERYGNNVFYNKRGVMETVIDYFNGVQDQKKYRAILDPDNCDNGDETWMIPIQYTPPNFWAKFINVITAKLGDVGYNVMAQAFDPLAIDIKKNYEAKIKLGLYLQKVLGEDASKDLFEDENIVGRVAINAEEIEADLRMNPKIRMEMELEMLLESLLYQNDIGDVMREIDLDLALHYKGGSKVYLDKNGFPVIRRVNPFNLIVSNLSSESFKDLQHCGEIINVTFSELRKMAGDEFTKDEYENILLLSRQLYVQSDISGFTNYYSEDSRNPFPYDHSRTKLLEFYFYADDKMVHEITKNQFGNKMVYRKDDDFYVDEEKVKKRREKKGEYEVIMTNYKSVYKGYWIIGTEYVFGYGLQKDMVRVAENITDTKLPFTLYAPNLLQGINKSITEQCIPVIDDIIRNWLKMQQMINSAIPKGAFIDIEALEAVSLGSGGTTLQPADLLDLYYKRGIIIARRGSDNQAVPIQELENGLSRDTMIFAQLVLNGLNLLKELTGINDIVAGGQPKAKTGLGVSQIAIEGSNNALDHLIRAKKRIFEGTCQHLADLAVQTIANGNLKEMVVKGLGKNTLDFWQDNKDLTSHNYLIRIENKPDEAAWNQFYQQMNIALDRNQIKLSDVSFLMEIDNLKQARILLELREAKYEREKQANAMEAQRQNQEMQMMSAEQAQVARMEELQLEQEALVAKMKAEIENQLQLIIEKGNQERQNIAEKASSQVAFNLYR
jgi:hypothetical protein